MSASTRKVPHFKELVDVAQLQGAFDELYGATGIPIAIVAMDGELLAAAGQQKICTLFHRFNPDTLKDCIVSDSRVRTSVTDPDAFAIYECPRGLTDSSSPILIQGEHVSNVFIGQFFRESPTAEVEERFRNQARRFGYDEEAYMAAFREVPVFTEKKHLSALAFLTKLASLIAGIGLANYRKQEATAIAEKEKQRFSEMVEHVPVGLNSFRVFPDNSYRFEFFSERAAKIMNLSSADVLKDASLAFSVIHRDDIGRLLSTMNTKLRTMQPFEWEGRVCRGDDVRWIRIESFGEEVGNGESLWNGIISDIHDRKVAEEARLASERKYKGIFDNSPVAIWEEDFSDVKQRFDELRNSGVNDFRSYLNNHPSEVLHLASLVKIISVNEASRSLLGFENMEQLIRDLPRYFNADSLLVFKEEMIELAHGKTHFGAEIPIVDGHGETRLLDLSLVVSQDHEETLSRVLVTFIDITELKRNEASLRQSELRYDQLAQQSRTVAWEVDETGLYTYVSKVAEFVYGRPVEEIVNKLHFYDLHPENGREAFKKGAFEVFDKKSEFVGLDNPIQTGTGDIIWVSTSGFPILSSDGKLLGYRGSDIDITERKNAQINLQNRERYLQSIITNQPECVKLVNAHGTLIYMNPAGLRMIAAPSEGAVYGTNVSRLIAMKDRNRFGKFLADVCGGAREMLDFCMVDLNGVEHCMSSIAVPFYLDDTNETVMLGITRDVTEQVRGEDERERLTNQLMQSQKMESVGRLAGGVAHDFNNMLQAIIGNVELAIELTQQDDLVNDHLQEIKVCAERSAELTRQLLAFARKQTIAPKILNLNETIEGMLKMLRRLIGENITLIWIPETKLWTLRVDPSQIDQILANLCVNAKDAIKGTGTVTIETHNITIERSQIHSDQDIEPGEYVQLKISDTGSGMDRETVERLFEPFFTTKEVGKGTGLGLSTVYGIVKQNNGLIEVSSEVSRGTTFNILLPSCRDTAVSTPDSGKTSAAPRGSETILLVEDEPSVLNMTKSVLEQAGYTVLLADKPGDAINLVEHFEGSLDLVLSDVIMPEMNGWELVERLHQSKPELKCLFMSGYPANSLPPPREGNTLSLIQKPFTMLALSQRIRELLDQ